MVQIKTRQPETAPLTYRLDPIGDLVGYAAVCPEILDKRPIPSHSHDTSRAAFVPSCPFQWSAPASTATAPGAGLADTSLGADTVSHSEEHAQSWLARLRSRYVAWRERKRVTATWEMLDAQTRRDIGAAPDEVDHDLRSIPYWGWYTIL